MLKQHDRPMPGDVVQIDQLRAELAAAKEEIAKMRATIISAMVDVQHNLPGNGHAKLSLLLDGIMKQPRNNEERLLAERNALAADNERLRRALDPIARAYRVSMAPFAPGIDEADGAYHWMPHGWPSVKDFRNADAAQRVLDNDGGRGSATAREGK